ncbi:MAG: hypothetical protein M1833_006123 [Piccolia ochrophora]|nr:MAG: hypothetical protein M1833_006123 [Piccolia ochrophora]
MFSRAASVLPPSASSSHNPRRRQRTHSGENNISLPRAKRLRSALASDTFVKPHGRGSTPNGEPKLNGSVPELHRDVGSNTRDLPVREALKSSDRGMRGDGSVVLTRNEMFTVSKLPSLPDRIRNRPTDRLTGLMVPGSPYALALTPGHALVWSYESPVSSPETFTFVLPYPSKNISDPLPLGSIVTASALSGDTGLVVVMPLTGKITYWESITSAGALDIMRQQRHGFEGSVGRILSGESVVQLESAEPTGFILSFSSGRLAHMSVRDSQGKPAISVQFLKNSASGAGGIFGGLRNVFGSGGWRGGVAAVKAYKSSKRGQAQVVVLMAKGPLQIWDVQRGGHHMLRDEVKAFSEILGALKRAVPECNGRSEDEFELLDFSFVPERAMGDELDTAAEDGFLTLLILGAFTGLKSSNYAIIELSINKASIYAGPVHPIRCYTTPFQSGMRRGPRLLLPHPGQTAFVVFERAVVVASASKKPDSPGQQLLMDGETLFHSFEDVVDFRKDLDIDIVGGGAEDGTVAEGAHQDDIHSLRRRRRNPSCALLVRRGGVIRISAHAPKEDFLADDPASLTAKSKIEQAVYYGTRESNPLNFTGRAELSFPQDEVEEAALEISQEIVNSKSKAILIASPSLEHQLKERANALRALAAHLKSTYPPLSRLTKWKLLWDAEKQAAARAIWRLYDVQTKELKLGKETSLLAQLFERLESGDKERRSSEKGNLDIVRHCIVRGIDWVPHFTTTAFPTVAELYSSGQKGHATVAFYISQANDICLGALETGFNFRQENATLYGLANEHLEDGMLISGGEGLPEFWTSSHGTMTGTRMLVDLAREMAIRYWEKDPVEGAPNPATISKIREENPRQVDLCCKTYLERSEWCSAQVDEDSRTEAADLKQEYPGVRHVQIVKLVQLGLLEEAFALADKYRDMSTLVDLIDHEKLFVEVQTQGPAFPAQLIEDSRAHSQAVNIQIDNYFNLYGDEWANAFFTSYIAKGRLGSLLRDNNRWQQYLTRFLRANPAYAKVGWINDVLEERNFASAGQTLLDHAHAKETDLWSKKVELSIGKLSQLASHHDPHTDGPEIPRGGPIYQDLQLIKIQERLYEHVGQELYAAIDERAELDLAMQDFGKRVAKERPALRNVFEEGIAALVRRECLGAHRLINVLSLMDHRYELDRPGAVSGQEFLLALRALYVGDIEGEGIKDLLERIIWRRCMIRDDWTVINDTQLKDDRAVEQSTSDTALFMTLKAGYSTGVLDDKFIRPRAPHEVLGAAVSPSDLKELFPEDVREALALDMQKEDRELQRYIDKGRLGDWFTGIVDAAKRSVDDDIEAETSAAEEKTEMQSKLLDPQVMTNGHGDADDEGDVIMG